MHGEALLPRLRGSGSGDTFEVSLLLASARRADSTVFRWNR